MKKQPLIILAGPTAVGKTALSIALAKAVGGEIISCDSMQVYKHMDIGTAKIMPEEMQGVRHYLVDELEPSETFHVARFTEMAKQAIKEIHAKGRIPIAVGGTGFYIQALLYDTDFSKEDGDAEIRSALEETARKEGVDALHRYLEEIDPVSAQAIHPNNVKRVIRAIEFYKLHNKPISEHNFEERQKESPYHFLYFVLNDNRKNLYRRIDERVDLMIEQGLVLEVEALKKMGYTKDAVSMQGLGYKEILDYLDGNCTLPEAIYTVKRDTRHFAKRQLTWFRAKPEVIWVNKDEFLYDEKKILEFMLNEMTSAGITWKGQ